MQRRNTNQRFLVYDNIEQFGHISLDDLIKHIQKNHDNISLSTIYRNITILLDENKIKRVQINGREVLEIIKQKHYHFVCKKCNNIYDIAENKVQNFVDELKQISNNQVEECEISLYGICSKCRNKEQEK